MSSSQDFARVPLKSTPVLLLQSKGASVQKSLAWSSHKLDLCLRRLLHFIHGLVTLCSPNISVLLMLTYTLQSSCYCSYNGADIWFLFRKWIYTVTFMQCCLNRFQVVGLLELDWNSIQIEWAPFGLQGCSFRWCFRWYLARRHVA